MSHDHHQHDASAMTDARLIWAVIANTALTVAQIVGGIFSGSLSLVADALHNLNDAASLGVALGARRIARRPADKARTFGYRRAEIIGALINTTALILIGVFLIYEAIMRFFQPREIDGWIVVIVGGIALVVDLATALLTLAGSKRSINIKAAFVHNVADALGSVVVMGVGTLVLLFNWNLIDPLATLGLAGYILYQSFPLMKRSIHILMDGVPPDVDFDGLVQTMNEVEGVESVHHVHVRHLDEHHTAIEAHVVVTRANWDRIEQIKADLKQRLHDGFDIEHATLEFEQDRPDAREPDHDRSVVPNH
jgi:cobalt-zinc-cadmium efflux system protein